MNGLVNERFNNSILDVRTVCGTDGDSDHFLVATSEVKKKTRNKERRRHGRRFDITNLNNPAIVETQGMNGMS